MGSVKIKVLKDGSVSVEAFGFKGESCEEATRFLDEIFGSPEKRDFKDSYYENEVLEINGLPSGFCG